jgi:hypothetical protein
MIFQTEMIVLEFQESITKHRPTQRAPDWWESARFQAVYEA